LQNHSAVVLEFASFESANSVNQYSKSTDYINRSKRKTTQLSIIPHPRHAGQAKGMADIRYFFHNPEQPDNLT